MKLKNKKQKQRGEQGTGEAVEHYKCLKSESSLANKEQNPSPEPDKLDSVQMLRYFLSCGLLKALTAAFHAAFLSNLLPELWKPAYRPHNPLTLDSTSHNLTLH